MIGIGVVLFAVLFLIATRGRNQGPLGFGHRHLPTLPAVSLSAADLAELRGLNERGGKIPAIKRLREMRTLSLGDAKKVIDVLDAGGTIPVSSGTAAQAAPAWSAAAPDPSTTGSLADRTRLLRDRPDLGDQVRP